MAARLTVLVLSGLIASLIIIMCIFRVDRVITSAAGSKVVPTQQVNVFQALDPSIIRTIDVREGQRVGGGELLATLDPTFAAADVKQLRQQIASNETQIIRDEAELARHPLTFPERSDPDFVRYAAIQKAYYDQRMLQYKAQVDSFDAKIAQTKATIRKLENDAKRYQERQGVAERIETMRTTLAQSGSGSQLNMLISQDARLELQRNVENTKNALVEAQNTLASTTADREAFIQQWFTQLSQDLVTTRNSLDTARAQLDKAAKHQDLVRLTANEDSIVLTVAKLSVGSVLKEGDQLMTLMPVNTPLEAEARISSRDIGFVRTGDRCVLKVDAFNFIEHGTADGKVRWISEGAFSTDDNNQPVDPYYKVRCTIDASHFINVPANFRLIPGMTLTADLNVGSRSLAMYLLGGTMRGVGEAMREP